MTRWESRLLKHALSSRCLSHHTVVVQLDLCTSWSSSPNAGGSAFRMRSQLSSFDHRKNWRWSDFQLPKHDGSSRHGAPLLAIHSAPSKSPSGKFRFLINTF